MERDITDSTGYSGHLDVEGLAPSPAAATSRHSKLPPMRSLTDLYAELLTRDPHFAAHVSDTGHGLPAPPSNGKGWIR